MGFVGRWARGVRDLSVLDQLRAKRAAVVGQSVAVVVALVKFAVDRNWMWFGFLFFTLVLFAVELIGVSQNIREARKVALIMEAVNRG